MIIAACIVVPQIIWRCSRPGSAGPRSASDAGICCCWDGQRCRCAAFCSPCCPGLGSGSRPVDQRRQRGGVRGHDPLLAGTHPGLLPLQPVTGLPRLGCVSWSALSTTLSGEIADEAGMQVAFLVLGGIRLIGVTAVWLAMPETRPQRGARRMIAAAPRATLPDH